MVVNIRTEMKTKTQDLTDFFGGGGGNPDDLFHRFFGPGGGGNQDDQGGAQLPGQRGRGRRTPPREQTTRAAGTGFIISKDGFILTNNHVVEDATKIEVVLYGDDSDVSYQAKVIGRDPLTDSALIQLVEKPNQPLPEAKFGDSAQVEAGDWVMAIGNPFGYDHTVTVGVISATSRAFPVTDGRDERHAADRRGDQPGQLRRTAAQPARRSDRHQHRDHHQLAVRGEHRHRLRGPEQYGARTPAAAAQRQDHARAASACRCCRFRARRSRTSA